MIDIPEISGIQFFPHYDGKNTRCMLAGDFPINFLVWCDVLGYSDRFTTKDGSLTCCGNSTRLVNVGTQIGTGIDTCYHPMCIRHEFF